MGDAPRKITVRCPDCQTEMTLDTATGAVLHHKAHKAPPGGGRTFDDLFAEMEEGKDRAEEVFQQERAAFDDRERILAERFDEALKRAKEDPDEKPAPRPFELD